MRFADFLRTTVLACAASATLLAVITIAGVASGDRGTAIVAFSAGWWVASGALGLWLGRRSVASPAIASLLADARSRSALPTVDPARTLLNRLWPLLIACLAAAAVGLALPQVSAIAAGFAIVWALAWRRQAGAVRAIEDRDGSRFYLERISPWRPIELLRTPGFRSAPSANGRPPEPAGASRRAPG